MEVQNTLSVSTFQDTTAPVIKETQPLSFWKGVLYALSFLGIQILSIIPVAILSYAIYGAGNEEAKEALTLGLGLPIAFIIGTYVLYRKRGLIATAFQYDTTFLKLIPLGLLALFGTSHIITELMTFMPGYESLLADYQKMFAGQNPFLLLIGGVLIGPICEEIIFRGIILEGLLKKYNPTKAIIFSALIFGLIHGQPIQVIGAFFAGLVLGWIYLKTKSLWVCGAAHIINNLIAFTFIDISSTREYLANDSLYIASFGIAAVIAYLAFKYFNKVNKNNLIVSNSTSLN